MRLSVRLHNLVNDALSSLFLGTDYIRHHLVISPPSWGLPENYPLRPKGNLSEAGTKYERSR